jgi:DNA replication factor GINS
MNIDELQSVRDRERQTDKPQQLRESFYADVGAFVEQLRAERERAAERHDSPYADEVMQLTDEIDAAQQLVEDIHERRIGKVVKAASLEAAELSPEVDGLTTEERELFGHLVSDIEHHRQDVLSTVEGEDPGSTESTTAEDESPGVTTDSSETAAADLMGPDSDAPENSDRDQTGREPGSEQGHKSRSEHPTPEDLQSNTRGDADSTNGTAPDGTADVPGDASAGPDRAQQGGSGSPQADGHPAPETDGGDETDSGPPAPDDQSAGPNSHPGARPEADAEDGRSTPAHPEESEQSTPEIGADPERERVLITENVATFVGSDDRDYDLAAEDVVTLPSTNADLLVQRDAARRL